MNMDDQIRDHDNDREREIDRWLDDTLAQYGKVEPRPGLEGRVLARLAEARREPSRKLRWWSALAFSAAAILVLGVVWRQRMEPTRLPGNHVATIATPRETERHDASNKPSSNESLRDNSNLSVHQNHSLISHGKTDRPNLTASAEQRTEPKLDQFPAPRPLNEQEQLLLRYVQEFPQKAALMARAQTELRKQDELEMAAPWPKVNSTSEQQE